jgi:serine/threonine-protein kinase RsbW
MKSIRIQLPSVIDNIRVVESFIDNAREFYAINDDIYGNIMIAVTESVNNAIRHGNKENALKQVTLSLFVDEGLVKFVVEDEGDGFNIHTLADPTSPENLSEPGGRGIFLMKHLTDELHFANNGTKVEMTFYVN